MDFSDRKIQGANSGLQAGEEVTASDTLPGLSHPPVALPSLFLCNFGKRFL